MSTEIRERRKEGSFKVEKENLFGLGCCTSRIVYLRVTVLHVQYIV